MRTPEELVAYIRAASKARNTSLTKLEGQLGWSNGTIGKWAKGKNLPAYDKLRLLAQALELPLEQLMDETKPAGTESDGLRKYDRLSPENRAAIDALIERLYASQSHGGQWPDSPS